MREALDQALAEIFNAIRHTENGLFKAVVLYMDLQTA
jgi:hypothetical protein